MIKRTIHVPVLVLILALLSGCGYVARYDGPYRGRVIDAESGKPIVGVVVLGVWYTETPTPAGAVSAYYDAAETVTDTNGDFEIPGKGLKIFSTVGQINLTVFKAGYEFISNPWITFKVDESIRNRVRWEGDKVIITIKKLKMEEREYSLGPLSPPSEARKGKIILMLKEINKERADQGLDAIDVGR